MSSALLKGKLKAAREALNKKDFQLAHDTSLQILDYEPDNYNAKIFYGLALLELGRIDQSEQTFRSAIELHSKQYLGWQGLCKAYERGQKWEESANSLLELAKIFGNSEDATKCAETIQRLIDLRREHGSRRQACPPSTFLSDALLLYLPDSPLYSILSTLPVPDLTNPTATTIASSQAAIHNSLPILEEVVSLNEADERETFEKEVARRRTRLNAGSPHHIRNEVAQEVYSGSKLPYLYDEILNHPNTSDELRRQTESKQLRHKRDFLLSLPLNDPRKQQLAMEVKKLVDGVVLLRLPDELAWSVFINGQDCETIEGYDFDVLRQYLTLFPNESLTRLIKAYLAYLGVPLSDDEETITAPSGSLDDVFGAFSVRFETASAFQWSILAHRVMSEVYLQDRDYQATITVSEAGLELVTRHRDDTGSDLINVRKVFNVALATSLVHLYPPKHHTRALRILEEVLSQDPSNVDCLMGRGYVFQRAGRWREAASCFSRVSDVLPEETRGRLRAQEEHAWCEVQMNNLDKAISKLRAVIESLEYEEDSDEDKSRSWWRLGKAHWEMGADHREEAFQFFIISLKHSSSFAPAFTSLGIYYSEVANPLDLIRASKCFQKAFELDARESDAARRLAEGFADEREWDLVEVVANRAIEGEGGFEDTQEVIAGRYLPVNAWAWKASGVVHLNRGNYPSAIQAFQVALRAEPEDQPSWVRLGESYAKAGRHTAAFKALHRAQELQPDDWVCSYLIGDIHRKTGRLQEAIASFHTVLQVQPNDPGVLTSLARAHVDMGLSELSTGFLSRAQDSFVAALRVSFNFLDTNSTFHSFAWKVIADAIYYLSRVSCMDEAAVRTVLSQACSYLTSDTGDRLAGSVTLPIKLPDDRLTGTDALKVSVAAYSHRISLGLLGAATTGSAWFDFGFALFNLGRRIFPEGEQRDKVLKQALASIKEAIRSQPGEDNYWRALGDMNLVSQPIEAQHAYIRALEINPKNVDVWTSFGFLCFYHDDLELANEAFLKAQTLDPDHILTWVGQALIATRNGQHADSRMLLEHAVSLSADVPEADIMFSRREFDHYLSAGHSRRSSPNDLFPAFFALDRYLKQRPDDASALHLFGLICERIGHLELGVECTDRAISVLEAAYEESEDPVIERQFTIANTTVARLRLALRDYEGALSSFQSALGLLPEEREDKVLKSQCLFGSGLASFKLGALDAAIENFEAALVAAGDDLHMRGHATVLLAQTLWATGTEEGQEAAKSQLLDCITQDPENLTAINALAGMGILTGDDSLIDAALSELISLPIDLRHKRDPRRDSSYILKQHYLGQGNFTAALSETQKAVHAEPIREDARRALVTLLLQHGEPAVARGVIAQGRDGDIADLRESIGLRAVAKALSEDEESLREAWSMAHKGIMLAPWSRKSWAVLAYVKSRR
ncbi:TPR-like protein [Multifurca ochricompacta]|uniref:TPR-like protein n=1 Tax=Multifurca ochricompacta TaxID=376703 RepID=A0AAD4M8H0_9AGAM|nr:TPR-like protein [Multifurca ochricompacta]